MSFLSFVFSSRKKGPAALRLYSPLHILKLGEERVGGSAAVRERKEEKRRQSVSREGEEKEGIEGGGTSLSFLLLD